MKSGFCQELFHRLRHHKIRAQVKHPYRFPARWSPKSHLAESPVSDLLISAPFKLPEPHA